MKLLKTLVLSDLYVAFVSIGLGLSVYALYGIPLEDLTPLLITFLTTFFIYAANRQTDREADEINLPARTSFVKQWGQHLFYASIVGLIIAVGLAFQASYLVAAATLLAFFAGCIYSYRLPFLGRFKDYVVWKNIGVGLIYGFLVLITLAYFNRSTALETAMLFGFFFIEFFLISSFFDLRDVEGDQKTGIRTIPIMLGKTKTRALFHVLNLLPIALFFLLGPQEFIAERFFALPIISFLYALIYLIGEQMGFKLDFLCMVVADAQAFFASIIILLFL